MDHGSLALGCPAKEDPEAGCPEDQVQRGRSPVIAPLVRCGCDLDEARGGKEGKAAVIRRSDTATNTKDDG